MPNLSALLKAEITRLARKEVKATTAHLQKAATAYRSQIASLKRRTEALERQLRTLQRGTSRASTTAASDSADGEIPQIGLLFGTTGQAIYNWESGRARPRRKHMAALAALRKVGKKQAAEIVAARRSA